MQLMVWNAFVAVYKPATPWLPAARAMRKSMMEVTFNEIMVMVGLASGTDCLLALALLFDFANY
jgi:hypothetical protein